MPAAWPRSMSLSRTSSLSTYSDAFPCCLPTKLAPHSRNNGRSHSAPCPIVALTFIQADGSVAFLGAPTSPSGTTPPTCSLRFILSYVFVTELHLIMSLVNRLFSFLFSLLPSDNSNVMDPSQHYPSTMAATATPVTT